MLLRRRSLLCVALAAACTVDGSLGKDGADAGSTGGADTSVETTASSDATSAADAGDTTAGSTDSAPDASSGESDTHGSDTGAGACDPTMRDDACVTCTKTSCCDPMAACAADPTCGCIQACHDTGTPLPDCVLMCGDDGGLNDALETCIHDHCMAACA